jgi:2'-5' RNA ligase
VDPIGERSAIVVPIELPDALDAIRREHVENANLGVPAHVTLLFPFVPPKAIDQATLARVAAVVSLEPAFGVEFREVRRWMSGGTGDSLVWLPPEPPAPFVALTEALSAAFPEHPPYGGAHDEVVPHLTLATDDPARFDSIEAQARPLMGFRRSVRAASLLVEGPDGRWSTRHRFSLG